MFADQIEDYILISDNLGFQVKSDRPTVDWETLFESTPVLPQGMQRSKARVL